MVAGRSLFCRVMKQIKLFSAVAAMIACGSAILGAGPFPALELKVAYPELKFTRPVAMNEAPDGSGRLFLVEQGGKIFILPKERDRKDTTLFLDISDRKPHKDNEEGLLGLAFHPQFRNNGRFFIYYSQQEPRRSVVSEIRISGTDGGKADLSTERVLMEIPQPYGNHNGGDMMFGPDGFLYVSLGDGGAANDPHGYGQDLGSLLGKILRIDVDSRSGSLEYGIPRDNPFLAKGDVRPEIWAFGLRNVWRMSFDRETGELWAGDVGQNKFEEVNIIVKGGNYGWNVREGFHPFKEPSPEGLTFIDPVIEYGHSAQWAKESRFPEHNPGLSVTGGYVYRGKKIPELRGTYIYGDYNLGTIWGLRRGDGGVVASATLIKQNPIRNVASFAEDSRGELYVLVFDGKIYEFAEAPRR